MKCHGTVVLLQECGLAKWVIECQPHVRTRLKALFPRINKGQYQKVIVSVTPETCRDLQWFMLRYPLRMAGEARAVLDSQAAESVAKLDALEQVMAPGFKARAMPMALPLREYQVLAVEVLDRNGALLLADALGLGKTASALGGLTLGALPALVVCPTHLTQQWRDGDLKKFLPGRTAHVVKQVKNYALPPVDVVIISYAKLAAWADQFAGQFRYVIFDEVQELRHDGTAKYMAACAVRTGCRYAIGLSATPIYNYGGEMFNIMEVLHPGRLGSWEEFSREWCTWAGNNNYAIREPEAFGSHLRDEFLMLRRTRKDVGLELPAVQRDVVTVPYREAVLLDVQAEAMELARLVLEGTYLERGQAARELDMRLRQATGVAKATGVAEFVKLLVESGEKVLLFGWHREVFDVWMERLAEHGPVMYTGSESPAEKARAVEQFMNAPECKVMVMSLRSGSGVEGLQRVCSVVVFGELDWSPGVHEQCIGRANRDGLDGNVLAYFLVSDAGSDPVVADLLGLKRSQASGVVDLAPDAVELRQGDGGRMKKLAQDYLARECPAPPDK